jgi:hypothetical protein
MRGVKKSRKDYGSLPIPDIELRKLVGGGGLDTRLKGYSNTSIIIKASDIISKILSNTSSCKRGKIPIIRCVEDIAARLNAE